jgi:hypothetical protein
MKKLADIEEEEDDNNMPNYSRGYEDDVNNRDHARKRSESGPNSRRWEPCDPHFFFIRGALRHLVVHFPLNHTHSPGKMRRWEPPISCCLVSQSQKG